METVLKYVIYYLTLVLCPLIALVVCGFITALCRRSVNRLLGRSIGLNAVSVTSIIGTPVHEFGHAAMCVLFGHKIDKVVWLSLKKDSDSLGSVSHSYNKRSKYQRLGLIFIGLGPIFSGLAFILIVLRLCFPQTLAQYFAVASGASLSNVVPTLTASLRIMGSIFTVNTTPVWAWIIGLVLIAFVCLHLELSGADIRSSLSGMPVLLFLAAVVGVITGLLDFFLFPTLVATVSGALYSATFFVLALFMPVILFSLALLALSLVIYLVVRLFKTVFR